MKGVVCYFSASGVTERLAKQVAEAGNLDLYEIKPEVKYTSADLNWMDQTSRSTIEMKDQTIRPAIIHDFKNEYDTVYIGFPIWWYQAPTIINTFLESYDFSNKKIIVFATSGGSNLGKTIEKLQPSSPKANFAGGIVNPKNAKAVLAI